MDTLAKLISSLEIAIRYLLTGAVVSVLVVLSTEKSTAVFSSAATHLAASAFVVTTSGFAAFTVYRLLFWFVGDAIAWHFGLSAPCVFEGRNGYDEPYAQFLRWRHSDKVVEALGGYLTYRWAVAHFVSLTGASLVLSSMLSQPASPISQHSCAVAISGLVLWALGIWQSFFFYRVERNLCREDQKDAGNDRAQPAVQADGPASGGPTA